MFPSIFHNVNRKAQFDKARTEILRKPFNFVSISYILDVLKATDSQKVFPTLSILHRNRRIPTLSFNIFFYITAHEKKIVSLTKSFDINIRLKKHLCKYALILRILKIQKEIINMILKFRLIFCGKIIGPEK